MCLPHRKLGSGLLRSRIPLVGGFIQQAPDEGAPATERTDNWIFFDDESIYVGARVYESVPESEWVANEIPSQSLRFRPGADQVWGIQLGRDIRSNFEEAYLTAVPISAGPGQFRLSAAGTLVGLEVPADSRTFEIKPYAIGSLNTSTRHRRPSAPRGTRIRPVTNRPQPGLSARAGGTLHTAEGLGTGCRL